MSLGCITLKMKRTHYLQNSSLTGWESHHSTIWKIQESKCTHIKLTKTKETVFHLLKKQLDSVQLMGPTLNNRPNTHTLEQSTSPERKAIHHTLIQTYNICTNPNQILIASH
jgi:hypothetical protein